MPLLTRLSTLLALATLPFLTLAQTITVTLPADTELLAADGTPLQAVDGRLLLLLDGPDATEEPRFRVHDDAATAQVYGMDVEDWRPGTTLTFVPDFGYPLQTLEVLPEGEYTAQVLLHRYETFARADGHTVRLPMDRGEGQQWNRAPGNLLSTPTVLSFGESPTTLELTETIPPLPEPEDTEWVKHIRIRSELLSDFWGRDMYLGAHVLLPAGYAAHPEARYPLAIFHGHFPEDFGGFRTTDPDTAGMPCVDSERFGWPCYNRFVEQEAYELYRAWTSDTFPRVLAVELQHANPYYDDSYAVNSDNLGPYGDAITDELIPYIEAEPRGIGAPWARFLYGGSTGGWEAAAAQVLYPDDYNGAYAACPDPIDFRAYTTVNLYADTNAYVTGGRFRKTLRPGHRDALGHVSASLRDMNHRELALGNRSRSGQQWDVWEAVYSPVGKTGYPRPIWDKRTGAIDTAVANHWREHYDLTHVMQRDWDRLAPRLRTRLNVYCGDMDNYYLNNAVYLAEAFLRADPAFAGEITYGDRAEHCWNGDPTVPNAVSRLRYHRMFIPKWTREILNDEARRPAGADLESWRY